MPDAWEHTTYRQGVTLIYIARRKLLCRKRSTAKSEQDAVREVLISNTVSVCGTTSKRVPNGKTDLDIGSGRLDNGGELARDGR